MLQFISPLSSNENREKMLKSVIRTEKLPKKGSHILLPFFQGNREFNVIVYNTPD